MARLRALPLLWKVVTVVGMLSAAGGAVWGVYAYVRHEGYVEGFAKAEAECEAEQKKQEIANQNAISAANKRLIDLAEELTLQKLQVDDYVKAIDLATAADPDLSALCVDARGVQRLNRIR